MTRSAAPHIPLRIGISSCLLGRKVRYDGGHKRSHYITDILGEYLDLVPVCPELEVGMGVPREPVRLEGSAGAPRMIGTLSRKDWSGRMRAYSGRRVRQLDRKRLSGYLLKKGSPSCGLARVKVYKARGPMERKGSGLFAAALRSRMPLLPVEEEERLNNAGVRESFIVRVFAYHRLQNLFHGRWGAGRVLAFHAAHEYLLLAHSPRHQGELERLVASIKRRDRNRFRAKYSRLFMEALSLRSTVSKNVNALQRLLGFLKRELSAAERSSVLKVIEEYRHEIVPLVVPLTLVRHYLEKHGIAFASDQVYLNPHPKELWLRNHV